MAKTAGETSNLSYSFDWKIVDFFNRPEKTGEYCESPVFEFCNISWNIELHPNGYRSSEWISLYLNIRGNDDVKQHVSFKLAIKKSNGTEYVCKNTKHAFCKEETPFGWNNFLRRSELFQERSTLTPGDILTISCRMDTDNFDEKVSLKAMTPKRNGFAAEPKVLWRALCRNLKDSFLNQKNCDIFIKVKDQKFSAHRLILSARSSVFAAMLEHDMTENRNGIIEITDAEPSIFRDLLIYIYSGEVNKLSSENVCELYVMADKYDLEDLKAECTDFMECNLSIQNVCNVYVLANRYSEDQLKISAETFFVQNVKAVVKSDQWENIEIENQLLALQLLKLTVLDKKSS